MTQKKFIETRRYILDKAQDIMDAKQPWPEVFQLLITLSQDENPARRILNYNILEQLAEHVGEVLKPHTETLAAMFIRGCEDGVQEVTVAALQATGMLTILQNLE